MRFASVLSGTVLVSAAALAQTDKRSESTIFVAPTVGEACPIDLFAQRRSLPQTSRIQDKAPQPLEGHLELTFKQIDAPAILKVSGRVHGPSLGAHVESASAAQPGDVSEAFHLQLSAPSQLLQRSILTTHSMSNARWIELTRIDYTDGSHWQASPTSQCRATPNGFLLISSSR